MARERARRAAQPNGHGKNSPDRPQCLTSATAGRHTAQRGKRRNAAREHLGAGREAAIQVGERLAIRGERAMPCKTSPAIRGPQSKVGGGLGARGKRHAANPGPRPLPEKPQFTFTQA